MNWIDFSILGIIVLSTLISLIRGFVKEAISLVVWFCAFIIANQFYPDLASLLTSISDPMFRNGAAIAILFVATLIAGAIINFAIGKMVQATGLSGTDRVLGAVFGALRGVLIVSAILFFMDTFTAAANAEWWGNSLLIPEFAIIIEWFFEFMKTNSSFLKSA